MYAWEKGRKVALWGTGKNAKRHYYKLRDQYDIVAFIDNRRLQDNLFGLPVIGPDEIKIENFSIIICSNSCIEIEEQCSRLGYYLFEHFLPYYMIEYNEIFIEDIWKYARKENIEKIIYLFAQNKKIAYIHGNCQVAVIKEYLKACPEFSRGYIFVNIPPIHLNHEIDLLFDNIMYLSGLHVFFTQCISEKNEFDSRLGTENMVKVLKNCSPKVKIIRIPNLFFDLYFPQGGKMPNRNNVLVTELGAGVFPYADLLLDDLVKRFTMDQIVEIVNLPSLFRKEFIDEYVHYRFDNLKERDKECDIKIVDYIEKKYMKEQLFYSRNHPTNKVIKELVIRILCYMNICPDFDSKYENKIPSLNRWQEFIYPSVARGLRLSFQKKEYTDGETEESMNLLEVVKKYISYCHGIKDEL